MKRRDIGAEILEGLEGIQAAFFGRVVIFSSRPTLASIFTNASMLNLKI